MLADLWHSPDPLNTLGCSTIGSSEAAMLGDFALKWQWRKNALLLGKRQINQILFVGQFKSVGINLPVILTLNSERSRLKVIA